MTPFFCNLISNDGFHSVPEAEFAEPPTVGKVVEFEGVRWKITDVDEQELWLLRIETGLSK